MPVRSLRGPDSLTQFQVRGITFRVFNRTGSGRPAFAGGFLKDTVYVRNQEISYQTRLEEGNTAVVTKVRAIPPFASPIKRASVLSYLENFHLQMFSTLSVGTVNVLRPGEASFFDPRFGLQIFSFPDGRRLQITVDPFLRSPSLNPDKTVFPDVILDLAAVHSNGFGSSTAVEFHDNPFKVGSLPVNFVTLVLGEEITGSQQSHKKHAAKFIFDYIP